ncbi:MAG: cell division protein ZapB [Desulfovibrionaceae bacterium]|nr:cell division protein ZapB [Desulfovibrionaceae bacterium]
MELLDLLEGRVDEILKELNAVREENRALQEKTAALEAEVASLKDDVAMRQLIEEDVEKRVEALLTKLQQNGAEVA